MSSEQISVEKFKSNLLQFLEETFEHVHGIYLDGGTSLFETLETISAEEASRPVSSKCASIAGQVEHVRFYIEVLEKYMKGEDPGKVDWAGSWYLKTVTDEEWQALKGRIKAQYDSVLALVKSAEAWNGEDEVGNALAVLVHTAYHLGEIRQAMCIVKFS